MDWEVADEKYNNQSYQHVGCFSPLLLLNIVDADGINI